MTGRETALSQPGGTDELTLVPPARLGALLADQRLKTGTDFDRLAAAGQSRIHGFSATDLRRIERGELPLADDEISSVLALYGVPAAALKADRSALVIDLDDGTLWAGSRIADLKPDANIDEVLGRYVGLLHLLRDAEPGSTLPLRADDLEVLGQSLRYSISEVEQRLFRLMAPPEASRWMDRVRHRINVPAAGLLVGLTAVGSLVLVPFPQTPQTPALGAPAPATEVSAQSAVVVQAAPTPSGLLVPAGVAAELPPSAVPGSPQAVGQTAEALITYDWRTRVPGWTVTYLGPRPGYRGNTNTRERVIEIYVSPGDTPEWVAEVLSHELGHAIDVDHLSDEDRQRWVELRGLDGVWWPTSGRSDFAVGAGDFAEAVAALFVSSPSDSVHGSYSPEELALVAALLP